MIAKFFAGPLGLHITATLAPKFPLDHLEAWLAEVTKAMEILLSTLEIWTSEPHAGVSGANYYCDMLMSKYNEMVVDRKDWVEKVYPTMIKDLDQARGIFLKPMSSLILELERLRVIDHPSVFGFNSSNCVPDQYQDHTLRFHSRIAKAIIPFVDELGLQRGELWRTARQALAAPSANQEHILERSPFSPPSHILPFAIEITDDLYRGDAHGISLEGTNAERWEKAVLFQTRESSLATSRPEDPYNHHIGQFDAALANYLKFSRTDQEVDEKILALLEHYGPAHGEDLRMIVLKNSFVRRRIWKSELLIERVLKDWFPKLPYGESKEVTIWLPSYNIPTLVLQSNQPPHETLKLQTTIVTHSDQYDLLFGDFLRPFSFVGSRELQDRITYLTTAWIMTLLEAPAYPEVTEQNPSAMAIRGLRLHSKFLEEWPRDSSNYRLPFCIFRISAPSAASLKTLINLLFNKEFPAANSTTHPVLMRALRYVRKSKGFKEAIVPSMKILEDSEFSSWHRYGLNSGIISKLRPDDAKSVIEEMTQFVEQSTKRQNEGVRLKESLSPWSPV